MELNVAQLFPPGGEIFFFCQRFGSVCWFFTSTRVVLAGWWCEIY